MLWIRLGKGYFLQLENFPFLFYLFWMFEGDIWKGEIQNLNKLNQELRISAKLENRLNSVIGKILI